MQKVLIAGDVWSDCGDVQKILSEKYDLIISADIEETLETLQKYGNDILAVILDITMTETNKHEISEKIHKILISVQIPLIAITLGGDQQSQLKAVLLGATSFISKPYNDIVLINMLDNIVKINNKTVSDCCFTSDRLTGLLNREGFLEKARKMIHNREPGYYTLSCFDIENFKVINDQYGIEKGDEVLKHVAECVKEFACSVDGICCRFMADNFGLLFPSKEINTQPILSAHRKATVPECLKHTIKIRIGRYQVNDISLPISAMYDRATIAEESIRDMYDKCISEYSESMRSNIIHEQKIVNLMYEALKTGQFEPWFQPQYNHSTGAMIGSEALVRWKKDGAFISPAEFIPVFERNGFIYEMDKYIWESVCKLLRKWIDEGMSPLPVSVNISRRDLFHEHCIPFLDSLINKYDLPYDLLRLEVTESAFSESSKLIISKVSELINLGFTVEIDDFGSGYSSLNTLKDVPASILKLDMKFFENTENVQRGGNIIESVVRMARWLGMAVIAEGVEEKSQADFLKSIGCYYIQGYYYAKPMPAGQYEELLDSCQKEHELNKMQTIDNLDNNEFWNPTSMETLIFNSYIGGACIFEFNNGQVEMLRINEQYRSELGYFSPRISELYDKNNYLYLDDENRKKIVDNIYCAVKTKKEATCEIILSDNNGHIEYVRSTLRVIARTEDKYLIYCVIINLTDQRLAEQKQHEAERKEMEKAQQLEFIMDNINGGVSAVRIDENGKSEMIFSNERHYNLYGYTKQQADDENIDVMDLIIREDFDCVMKKVNQLKKSGISTAIDYRCIRRDGKIAYLRANSSRMTMDGHDDVIASVVTDITEQKEMAQQLRAIIDNINGGVAAIVIRDSVPVFIIVNDRFYEILGYTKEQYESECSDRYMPIHPDDRGHVIEQFENSMKYHERYSMEYRIVQRDGQIRHIQNNISVINIMGIDEPVQLAVMNDITELRTAQQEIAQTNDRLSAVMNNAGNGITAIIMHKDGPKFLFANDFFYKLHGCTRDDYKTHNFFDAFKVIHPDDSQRIYQVVGDAIKNYKNIVFEFRIILPDGKIRWIKTSMNMTNMTGIEYPVAVSSYSDITAEKESDEQLRFLNDSAHDIISQNDSDKAIDQTLEKMLRHFNADRAYVFEVDFMNDTLNNTYEICADGVISEKDRLQNIPSEISAFWFKILNKNRYVVIEDINKMDEDNAELQELLRSQGIRSLLIAPLWRDGRLIGFAGIDNPMSLLQQDSRLMALSDYIAILIMRRDLSKKIKQEISEQKKIAENLRKAELEYKIAIQHSGRTICRYEINTKTLTITSEAAKIFSLPECLPDVPYSSVRNGIISPDTADAYTAFYENIINGKEEGKVEFKKLLPVGWRWLSAHSTTIFSKDGTPVSAVISYVDITSQKEK